MTPHDRKNFIEVVLGFAELKGKQLSAPALELYWRALQHWTLEELRAAAEQLVRTCEFMPTPKDFEDLRRAAFPTAAEAWIAARRNAGSAIVCGQVTRGRSCGDPLIDQAVEAIGGYGAIAMCDVDKLTFLERRFTQAYTELQDVHETREAVPLLASPSQTRRLSGPAPAAAALPEYSLPIAPSAAAPPKPNPSSAPRAMRPRPTKTVEQLQADVLKLAAAGLDAEAIAKALGQHGVTVQQVSDWLASGSPKAGAA